MSGLRLGEGPQAAAAGGAQEARGAGDVETAFWGEVSRLPGSEQVEAALHKLGVQSSSDLQYVTYQDLVDYGLPAVWARRLLASAQVPSAAPPAASQAAEAMGAVSSALAAANKDSLAFSAEGTMNALTKKGVLSGNRKAGQVLCSSFLGGALLGWGCAFTTVVAGGTATFLAEAPGLLAFLTGAVFPVGLAMVLLSGSELLTGNFVTMALPAWKHPGVPLIQVFASMLRIWGISGFGNLVGSVLVAVAVFALSVVPEDSPAASWLMAVTVKKCSLSVATMVGKGAGANWLVNVAIFQAASAHTTAGKIASLWIPTMVFVTLGLEHSVANMFFLPLGMFLGADVDFWEVVVNLVFVALGNALGAITFVAGVQRYSLLKNQ